MIDLFDRQLNEIDGKISAATAAEIPALFHDIPLDIFGYLLLGVPARFPHIKAVFPSMPSNEEQAHWTGCHGVDLLTQSLSFVKTVLSGFATLAGRRIENAEILDFGCGWGRILRLFFKHVSSQNLLRAGSSRGFHRVVQALWRPGSDTPIRIRRHVASVSAPL